SDIALIERVQLLAIFDHGFKRAAVSCAYEEERINKPFQRRVWAERQMAFNLACLLSPIRLAPERNLFCFLVNRILAIGDEKGIGNATVVIDHGEQRLATLRIPGGIETPHLTLYCIRADLVLQ